MLQTRQLLQGEEYEPEVVDVLTRHQGNLDTSFDELWLKHNEPQMLNLAPEKRPSL